MSLVKHIPNTITSMNLLCGAMGVICAFRGQMDMAFCLMLLAAVFDFCDGLAARFLNAYSNIGKELDSLCDMVSFGLLPSLLLVTTMHFRGLEGWIVLLPLFLAVMSALRLAKFNVDERQQTDFIGVATPTAAIICGALACYIYLEPDSLLANWAATAWFLPAVSMVLGLLLVSEIPMFSIKIAKGHKLLDAKHIVLIGLVAASIAATAILGLNWSIAVLAIFSCYIVENLIIWILKIKG